MSYIDLPIRRLEQTKILRRNSCYCDDCGNKYSKSILELKEDLQDWEYRKNLTNFQLLQEQQNSPSIDSLGQKLLKSKNSNRDISNVSDNVSVGPQLQQPMRDMMKLKRIIDQIKEKKGIGTSLHSMCSSQSLSSHPRSPLKIPLLEFNNEIPLIKIEELSVDQTIPKLTPPQISKIYKGFGVNYFQISTPKFSRAAKQKNVQIKDFNDGCERAKLAIQEMDESLSSLNIETDITEQCCILKLKPLYQYERQYNMKSKTLTAFENKLEIKQPKQIIIKKQPYLQIPYRLQYKK
ncbi:hypothetical protein pb186bvf_006195 [Paramecium bursaria]